MQVGVNASLRVFDIEFKFEWPSEKDFSYADLAKLSLSGLPFSIKVLPAVICDSQYIKRIGRRRTWALIGHTVIAISLVLLYAKFDQWVEDKNSTAIAACLGVLFTGSVLQEGVPS